MTPRIFVTALLFVAATAQGQPLPFYPPQTGVTSSVRDAPVGAANAQMALIAWSDDVNCDGVCGVRYSAGGLPLDTAPRTLSLMPGSRLMAVATDGDTFLTAQTVGVEVWLVAVSADGTPKLIARRGGVNGLALAWDGSAYVVAEAYPSLVQATRITRDGKLIDQSTVRYSFSGGKRIAAAANAAGNVAILWEQCDGQTFLSTYAYRLVRRFPACVDCGLVGDGSGFLAGGRLLSSDGTPLETVTFPGDIAAWNGSTYVAVSARSDGLAIAPVGSATPVVLPLGASVRVTALVSLAGGKLLAAWRVPGVDPLDGRPMATLSAAVIDTERVFDVRTIATGLLRQVGAVAAWCGDAHVVVWVERGATTRLRAGRVRADGTLSDEAGIAVGPNVTDDVWQNEPVVTCTASSSFAVAWKERSSPTGLVTIKIASFPSGRVSWVSGDAFAKEVIGLASDGDRYLVVWHGAGDRHVVGRRFSGDGLAIDPLPLILTDVPGEDVSAGDDNGAALQWDGGGYVLVWSQMVAPILHPLFRLRRLTPELTGDGPVLDVTALHGLIAWSLPSRFGFVRTDAVWFVREVEDHGTDGRIWLAANGVRTFVTIDYSPVNIPLESGPVALAWDGTRVFTIDHGIVTFRDAGDHAGTFRIPDPAVAFLAGSRRSPVVIASRRGRFVLWTAEAPPHRRIGG